MYGEMFFSFPFPPASLYSPAAGSEHLAPPRGLKSHLIDSLGTVLPHPQTINNLLAKWKWMHRPECFRLFSHYMLGHNSIALWDIYAGAVIITSVYIMLCVWNLNSPPLCSSHSPTVVDSHDVSRQHERVRQNTHCDLGGGRNTHLVTTEKRRKFKTTAQKSNLLPSRTWCSS